MQKKYILPVAVLGLAMLTTACSNDGMNNQGMSPTDQGYTTGQNYTGYKNSYGNGTTDYNRVTNNYSLNPFNRTNNDNISPYNQNTTTDRGFRNQLYNFNRTSTNNVGPSLNDVRDTNPNVRTTNVTEQANKIAKMVNGVRGVDSAKTLIVGDTVYVGLDIDSRVSRRNVARIEQEVHRVVQSAYPGYDVRVTSDRGLFQRTGTFFNNDLNRFNNWEQTGNALGNNR